MEVVTVKKHVGNIFRKLGAWNRTQAAVWLAARNEAASDRSSGNVIGRSVLRRVCRGEPSRCAGLHLCPVVSGGQAAAALMSEDSPVWKGNSGSEKP